MKQGFASWRSLLLLCVLLVCLAGCGTPAPEPSQAVGPELTPEPTPVVYTYDGLAVDEATESLALRTDSDLEELAALAEQLPSLSRISFGSREPTPEELALLRAAFPDAELHYSIRLGGQRLAWDTAELDLSALTRSEVEETVKALPLLEKLRYVDLGSADEEDETALTLEDVHLFQQACPEVDFAYSFSLYNVEISTLDEELNFKRIKMRDEGEAVRAILPCMPRCRTLDMDSCGVSNEAMAAIRDDFPDIKVIWRVYFGSKYAARTDATRILASDGENFIWDYNSEALKYCTDVVYLDLGHNQMEDISFVSYMPNLEVAILAINYWSDASPLANCPNLEYLEIFSTRVTDLSPLAGLTNLKHLNIAYNWELEDISPLYGLTNLERLWIGCVNEVPQEQIEEIRRRLPDCEINSTAFSPTSEGWRDHERYELLREQFEYDHAPFNYK